MGTDMKIYIGQEYDGFFVTLTKDNGEVVEYGFNQEDTVENLVDVFKQLGVEDVKYEEVC